MKYLVFFVTSALASFLPTPGLLVPTHQGLVLGTSPSRSVRQFLGVPYASYPTRFTPPQAPNSRTSILKANQFSVSCPQEESVGDNDFVTLIGLIPPPRQGEDCLSLNIWAPAIGRKQGTAVMIWVHGGSFQFGSSDIVTYHGRHFVENNDDITIVTINYRLHIFGAPQAPQLMAPGQPQNLHLLDIDAAIQWVFDNIAEFGGNPERITIFGESAGAGAVDAFAYSHVQDKRVKGIICESGLSEGQPNTPGPAPDPTLPTSNWNTVANLVGCGIANDAKQLACMQNAPFESINEIVSNLSLPFGVVADDVTWFKDGAARSAAGNFLKVPLLTGTNANELDIIFLLADILTNTTTVDFSATSDAATMSLFQCPVANQASDRAKAGVSTFRYLYEGIFPNLTPLPILRAYHSAEIALVFGTFADEGVGRPSIAPTANEIALSKYIQTAWVTFARDPQNGLKNDKRFGWPNYDMTRKTIVTLGGAKNPSGATIRDSKDLDVCKTS